MSSSSSTTPLLPPPSIRQIWGVNAKEEFQLIENAEHPYVSIDTEFPGCIIKVQSYMQLKPKNRYELMKSNVDSTKLIQLGITLTNESGDLPKFTGSNNGCDIMKDAYTETYFYKASARKWFQLRQNEEFWKGSVLADLLVSSGVAGRENKVKAYVLFQGAYDLGYLVKLLSATELSSTLNDFLLELKNWFGKLYDVKYIIKKHQMHGGLDRIAEFLDLKREVGVTHDTGSDGFLTWKTFKKIRQTL